MKNCPHCGKSLEIEGKDPIPWYCSTPSMVVSFLCVGPLMLPLLWMHPTMTKEKKTGWTAAISILSIALIWTTVRSLQRMYEYFTHLGSF